MSATRLARLAALVGIPVLAAACADDPTEPQRYWLSVMNHHPHTMIASYDDGAENELGPVAASATKVFQIQNPRTESVKFMAENEAQTHTFMKDVTLVAGDTVMVEITMEQMQMERSSGR